jgi:Ala-tRNA(Pro) deacylase
MISTHERLIALLDEQKANFRIVEHKPEGRSEQISKIRGNEPNQAMKAIVVSVRGGGGGKRYALAVLPGIRRLDMKSLCKAMGAQKGKFATTEEATKITGCVMGAVPPFSFSDDLPIFVDPICKENTEVVFNAGRLDKSIFMKFEDYERITNPKFYEISVINS